MKLESDRDISIEDLLHLKRAERPDPEFWESFDKQLRARQLAAIVHRRPWWQGLVGALARRQVAIGAAAALIVAVAGAGHLGHQYRTGESSSSSVDDSSASDRDSVHALIQGGNPDGGAAEAVSVSAPSRSLSVRPATSGEIRPAAAPVARSVAHEDLTGSTGLPLTAPFPSPSEHLIAVSLTAVQAPQSDFALGRFSVGEAQASIDSDHSGVAQSVSPATEPLSQIDPASQERRSRLLNSALPVAAVADGGAVASIRVAQNLDDDRLYRSISRYGVDGDRFSIKF